MIPGVPLLAQNRAVDQPASYSISQSVPAAATIAPEVSQHLLEGCTVQVQPLVSQFHVFMTVYRSQPLLLQYASESVFGKSQHGAKSLLRR